MVVAAFDTSILFVERGWRAAAAAEATVASSKSGRFLGLAIARFLFAGVAIHHLKSQRVRQLGAGQSLLSVR